MINKYLNRVTAHLEIEKPMDKGDYIGNQRCHKNSLNYALKKKQSSEILGCLQIFDDSSMVAHFVVKMNNGDIIDPTFGRLSSTSYSYLIVIESYKISTFNPNRELTNLKKYIYNLLPWYLKLFTSYKGF